ncbi:hypothetical protein BJY01DRAFT_260404 [Aspergillus pseudoustus]|uniref:FAD-binding domain-containing protein n=1 Tax=Aspergillus pseudoustus TaxID=1810923 RepID=A0ABR4IWJ1_9EURO
MALQDVLGQLPLLKSYTHILLCFSLPDSEREAVLNALQCATKRLLAAFPFLAGNVVHRGIAPGNSGTFTVEYEADNNNPRNKSVLSIKDLSSLLPAYSTVSAAQAPPSMLPGPLVAAPRPAFPRVYNEEEEPAPVLDMQASLITGGLLLDIAAQHNIVDATGIFYIAHQLSKLMDVDDDNPNPNLIPHADLLQGNCDRQNLVPLLPPDEPLSQDLLDIHMAGPSPAPSPPPLDPAILSEYKWHLLHFNREAIAAIHTEANSQPDDFVEPITSVSINDAITAFVWQRLTIARSVLYPPSSSAANDSSSNSPENDATTQLTRAADLRRTMNLSPAYMGHMVRTANLRLPITTIATSSLSHLASHARATILASTTPHAVRAYATLLSRTRDKSRILYAGRFNPLRDFSCSSVAHIAIPPPFGSVLGKPEFVRRPTFGALPGGMYLGPPGRGREGVDAVVCFRGLEMEALRGDEGWMGRVNVVDVLALGLLRRNIQVTIYEQSQSFREIGAGIAFTANARECLALIDSRLDACVTSVATMNGEDPDNPNCNMQFVDGHTHDPVLHTRVGEDMEGKKVYRLYAGERGFEGCHRAQFLESVMRLLPQRTLRFGKRLQEYHLPDRNDREGKICLVFCDGCTAEADIVIGCDGIKSRVRQLLFGASDPIAYPHYTHKVAYRGLVPIEKAITALGRYRALNQHMYGGPGAHVLHFPVASQKLMNVVAFVDDPDEWPLDRPMTQPATRAELEGAFASWGPTVRGIVELLLESEGLDKWAVFDMYEHPAEFYAKGRVCLAGDAAHASAPHHGAGAGIGVEDALALCILLEIAVKEINLQGSGQRTSKAKVLERALKVFSDVRFERSQWLVRSSREVCDVYEWISQGCGRGMDKGFEDVKVRSHQIWYFDIQGMIQQLNRELDMTPAKELTP